jgi:hypothetical protein
MSVIEKTETIEIKDYSRRFLRWRVVFLRGVQHNPAKFILGENALRPGSKFVFPAKLNRDNYAPPRTECGVKYSYIACAHKYYFVPKMLGLYAPEFSICRIEILNFTFDLKSL